MNSQLDLITQSIRANLVGFHKQFLLVYKEQVNCNLPYSTTICGTLEPSEAQMMPIALPTEVKVADEVWIATALLHREHPGRPDFAVDEIVDRAKREGLSKPFRKGVYVHAVQHCVANRVPNSGRYRMLVETAPG